MPSDVAYTWHPESGLNEQAEQRQAHSYGEHTGGWQVGGDRGCKGGGLNKCHWQLQNGHGDVPCRAGDSQ